MKKFARTLRTHHELLLNYFRAHKAFAIGVIEVMTIVSKQTCSASALLLLQGGYNILEHRMGVRVNGAYPVVGFQDQGEHLALASFLRRHWHQPLQVDGEASATR